MSCVATCFEGLLYIDAKTPVAPRQGVTTPTSSRADTQDKSCKTSLVSVHRSGHHAPAKPLLCCALTTLSFSVHPSIQNKPVHWLPEFASGWEPLEGSLEDLRAHVTSGGAFIPAAMRSDRRSSAAFLHADLAVVDVDHGLDLDAFAAHPLAAHACFVYTTASHTPEHPRFRVIFRLPSRIDKPELYKAVITLLTTALGGDRSCTDSCRLFYGSDTAEVPHWQPDAVLPYDILDDARTEYRRSQVRRAESLVVDDLTIDQAIYVLENVLEPTADGERDRFIKITAAACSGGDALFSAWQNWASRCHHTSGHRAKQGTERFFNSFRNSRASLPTLFYLAEQDHPDWRSSLPAELRAPSLTTAPTHRAAGYDLEDYMHGGLDNPAFGEEIPQARDATPSLFDADRPWAVPAATAVATPQRAPSLPADEAPDPDDDYEDIPDGFDDDDCFYEDSGENHDPAPPARGRQGRGRRGRRGGGDNDLIRIIHGRLRELYPGLRRNLMNQEMEYGPTDAPLQIEGIHTAYCRLSLDSGRVFKKTMVVDVAHIVADENAYHPVRSYLDKCAAQATPCPYFKTLATELLGLRSDPLLNPVFTRGPEKGRYIADVILERFLIGAVARVLNPGCTHDWMPILIGPQNCGKSAFFQYITPPSPQDPGIYPWSVTIQQGIRTIKEKPHLIHAGWVVVLDEVERYFQRSYVEEFKNLVSVAVDRSRRVYENERNFRRAFVLAAAANSEDFLVDPTGNRRFMPIVVAGKVPSVEDPSTLIIDLDRLKQDRDAIWAAAHKAYLDNPVHTFSADEVKQVAEYQENFRSDNPFDGKVRAVLRIKHSGIHHGQSFVTMNDLYDWLDIPVDRHASVKIPLADALKSLGYKVRRCRIAGETRRIWVREKGDLDA